MASLTIHHGECNGGMACTAVFSLEDFGHSVLDLAPFHSTKYVRVAEFASVPDRMLLMGEYDVRHSFQFCPEGKILLRGERFPLNRDALDKVHRIDDLVLFRLFPVNTVPEPLFGETLREHVEVIFRPHIPSQRVAALTPSLLIRARCFGARLKHLLPVHGCPSVMAGAAVVAADVIRSLDSCGSCLHAKSYINVTEPAGELCAMKPVIKHHRSKACLLGIVVDNHPPNS